MPICSSDTRTQPEEKIPHVSVDPRLIQKKLGQLRHGLTCGKVTESGSIVERSIVIDRAMDFITYSPSKKDLGVRQMRFVEIARISDDPRETLMLEKASLPPSKYALTLITHHWKAFSFVFDEQTEATEVMESLAYVVRKHRLLRDESAQRMRVIDLWMEARLDEDSGELPFEGLIDVAEKLGLTWSRDVLRQKFNEIDVNGNGGLDYEEFCLFVDRITLRPQLEHLFLHYVNKDTSLLMAPEQFRHFLLVAQGEKVSLKTSRALVKAIGTDPEAINFGEFCQFLTNAKQNSWFKPAHNKVFHRMNHPLNHYFIATSHNTCVESNQVDGTLSRNGLQVALSAGCRAVELEIGDGEVPMVIRAFSECMPFPAEEALVAIRESAFVASDYPVIVTVEMHATDRTAKQFADMAVTILGDRLYTLDDADRDDYKKFSPEALAHRILIMYKMNRDDDEPRKDVRNCPALQAIRDAASETKTRCADLCALAFLVPEVHDQDWGRDAEAFNVGSYPHDRLDVAYTKKRFKFTAMNRRMFTRVYPTSESSTNFSPLTSMAIGSQMVAMNYQTWDDNMRLYDGLFAVNGRCGYLLKPEYMRDPAVLPPNQPYLVTVNVLLGTQLPFPESHAENHRPHFKVIAKVVGSPEDTATNPERHTSVNAEDTSPFWNEEFQFTVTNIDLAAIVIRVVDQEELVDNSIGESVCPLLSLRLGYRAVPLFSCFTGKMLPNASLLCHFRISKTEDNEVISNEWLASDVEPARH